MGLDIYFYRVKREGYEELDKLDELHNAVPDMDEVEEEIGYSER